MFFKNVLYRLMLHFLFICSLTNGFPLREPELKDETHFPNGTVIGKYTYMDSEGNPIYVKYYADDASYGVELQSKKVIESGTDEPSSPQQKNDVLKSFETTVDTIAVPKETIKTEEKDNAKDARPKNNKISKSKLEYEVFYQNNLQNPNRCGNDKVKVYLDKQRRIARDTLNQAEQYCDRILD